MIKIRPNPSIYYCYIGFAIAFVTYVITFWIREDRNWTKYASWFFMSLNPLFFLIGTPGRKLEIWGDGLHFGKKVIAREQVYQIDFSEKGAVIFERSGKIHELIRKIYRSDEWTKVEEVLGSWGV